MFTTQKNTIVYNRGCRDNQSYDISYSCMADSLTMRLVRGFGDGCLFFFSAGVAFVHRGCRRPLLYHLFSCCALNLLVA